MNQNEFIPEKLKNLLAKANENKYSVDIWNQLIREAQALPIDKARKLYEKIVAQFPLSGRYWKIYIEHEVKTQNVTEVEKLFARCLLKVLNIDLWRYYLQYVRESKRSLPNYSSKMQEAYTFATEKIGLDVQSIGIWCDYILFLKNEKKVGTFQENVKITQIRKVYRKVFRTPMSGIENIWKDYEAWEFKVNQNLAKKMIDEAMKDYKESRRISKELEARTRSLQRNQPAVPPLLTNEAVKQVELWKQFILWEKSNPMKIDDVMYVTKRVMFAYEQCLLCLAYYPDVWYEATDHMSETSKLLQKNGDTLNSKKLLDQCSSVYERAVTSQMMRENQLLQFAYADFEESRGRTEKCHEIYRNLLKIKDQDHTLTYIQYMKFARRSESVKSARHVFRLARENPKCGYQVYVAAAMMEYHCSKNSSVAFRIYELGLKKFENEPKFLEKFLECMGHLNEDNNTRVVFEKILTSKFLSKEHAKPIWDKYCKFENHIGDLPSMLKVEERKLNCFRSLYEDNKSKLLVDRYKFMDLYPCDDQVLQCIGYKTKSKKSGDFVVLTEVAACKEKDLKSGLVTPDFSQMLPYKPKVKPFAGYAVPGGEFPKPELIQQMLNQLPPPKCFQGPHVKIDLLMRKMSEKKLPSEKEWVSMVESGGIGLVFNLKPKVPAKPPAKVNIVPAMTPVNSAENMNNLKRPAPPGNDFKPQMIPLPPKMMPNNGPPPGLLGNNDMFRGGRPPFRNNDHDHR